MLFHSTYAVSTVLFISILFIISISLLLIVVYEMYKLMLQCYKNYRSKKISPLLL